MISICTFQAKYDSRELNPFWKNGGTGLPDNVPTENVKLCAVTTGDHGVEWLYKSLQRCKERAKDENRPLEDVAADHWGVSFVIILLWCVV